MRRRAPICLLCSICLLLIVSLVSCGGGSGGSTPPSSTIVSVAIQPATYTVPTGTQLPFMAAVTGTGNFNPALTWSVNDVVSGNAMVGTITATGVYTAPVTKPNPATVTVKATSVQDSTKSGTSQLTVQVLINSVDVSPCCLSVRMGATQQFTADVKGIGVVDPSVRWFVNGVQGGNSTAGTITSSGLYSPPASLPQPNSANITAQSLADPTKAGGVQVAIWLPSNAVHVSPGTPSVTLNHTTQFAATVDSTATQSVWWSAQLGSITPEGLYTAPAYPQSADDVVTAISQADGNTSASTPVHLIVPPPSITSISTTESDAGQAIQINGEGFYGTVTAYFTGQNGVPLAYHPSYPQYNNFYAVVPLGTVTGPVWVEVTDNAGQSHTSNSVQLTRLPRIRLRAERNDLAAGESTVIHLKLLGGAAPAGISWTATSGTVDGSGNYTAPVSVPSESFDRVTACVDGTSECRHLFLRLRPFRTDPANPVVALGGSVNIYASADGLPVPAAFDLWNGGGALAGSAYTAGLTPADGGIATVHSTFTPDSANAFIGVLGGFTGTFGRIFDWARLPDREASYADSVATFGNRAFVFHGNELQPAMSQSVFYLDTYDITDPSNPVWIDTIEPVMRPQLVWMEGATLYVATGMDYVNNFGGQSSSAMAAYDVSTGVPLLAARGLGVFDAVAGQGPNVYWCTYFNTGDANANCHQHQLSGTSIQRTDLAFPVPAGVQYSGPAMARSGDYAYLGLDEVGMPFHLLTYSLATNPPALLDFKTLETPLWEEQLGVIDGVPRVVGNRLLIANSAFDITNGVPELLGTMPVKTVIDATSDFVLGLGPWDEQRIFDIRNPGPPVWSATHIRESQEADVWNEVHSRLHGNLLLGTDGRGGLSITDISQPGGIHDRRMFGNPGTAIFDMLLRGNLVYAAEAWGIGGALEVWNISQTPVANVAEYIQGTETPWALADNGDYLYLGTDAALRVLNISNPSTPSLGATLPIPAFALKRVGNTLFVARYSPNPGGCAIVAIDVSNPSSLTILGELPVASAPLKFAVSGNYLLGAAEAGGLYVVNIANPASMSLVSTYQTTASIEDVAVDGNILILAAAEAGIVTVDFSNPAAPVTIGSAPLPYWIPYADYTHPTTAALSVALHDGLAYIGSVNGWSRVYLFDYSKPAHPRMVGVTRQRGLLQAWVFSFVFSGTDMYFGGWNADDDGFIPPITAADVSQPRNVILPHPANLETITSAPPSLPAGTFKRPAVRRTPGTKSPYKTPRSSR